jgi:hypothetical protein
MNTPMLLDDIEANSPACITSLKIILQSNLYTASYSQSPLFILFYAYIVVRIKNGLEK